MRTKPKSLTAPYAVMQLLYWSALCMGQTYAMPFLCDMGLSDGQIGVILAIVNGVVLPLSMVINTLYTRMTHGSLKHLIVMSGFSLIAALLIMYSAFGHSVFYVTVAFSLVMVFMIQLNGLINTLGMIYESQGIALNFAVGRGMGSLGYALAALCMGRLLLFMESRYVMLLSALTVGVMLMLLVLFPENTVRKEAAPAKELPPSSRRNKLFRPAFVSLLFACTLLLVSNNTFSTFLLQITLAIGKSEETMGRFAALAAVLEVPAILAITALRKHFSDMQILRFCATMFIVKFGAIFLLQDSTGMYLTQAMQPFSYALLLPVSAYYVNTILPPQYAAMGQILLVSTSTVANMSGSLIGGMVLQRGTINALLGMIVGFAVTGCLMLWLTTAKKFSKIEMDTEPREGGKPNI